MKQWGYLSAAVLFVTAFLPTGLVCAQSQGKKSLPQVPVTYAGDTEKTTIRRAQWIEGAKKESQLVWWSILNPSEAKGLISEFNKIYPFIKVDYWRGEGEELAAKLEAEVTSGRHFVDVLLGSEPYNYPRWRKKGVLEKYIDIIPGSEKMDKRLLGTYGDSVLPSLAPKIPQYNTKLLSAAEAPKTWEDLLNPKWKGQLGNEIESNNWAYLALGEGGWGLEKTEDFLTKLKEQKPRFVHGGSATHALLIAGEFKINVLGNLRHVLVSQKKKAPVDWVRVNPIVVGGPSFILSRKAPHPNAARLFLEWQFSRPGLQLMAEISQNYIPGIETPMAKLMEGVPLVVRTEEIIVKMNEMGLLKRFNKLYFGIEE